MQLTAKVHPFTSSSGNLIAFASLIVDDLIEINGFKVLERKDGSGRFVSAPSSGREIDGEMKYFDDVRFLDWEDNRSTMRDEVTKVILDTLEQALDTGTPSRADAASAQTSKFRKTSKW